MAQHKAPRRRGGTWAHYIVVGLGLAVLALVVVGIIGSQVDTGFQERQAERAAAEQRELNSLCDAARAGVSLDELVQIKADAYEISTSRARTIVLNDITDTCPDAL